MEVRAKDTLFLFALERLPPVVPASTFDSHTYDSPLAFAIPLLGSYSLPSAAI